MAAITCISFSSDISIFGFKLVVVLLVLCHFFAGEKSSAIWKSTLAQESFIHQLLSIADPEYKAKVADILIQIVSEGMWLFPTVSYSCTKPLYCHLRREYG